jgi:nucleoside-diphosphate-sugar epimerase
MVQKCAPNIGSSLDMPKNKKLPEQQRAKVLVAGAGGSIGSAVSRALAEEYEVVALVGSRERLQQEEPGLRLTWRSCEPFSRRDVETAVTGCDYLIYLIHTRVPTARMDQAECRDMDLLIADNVARAASRQSMGVREKRNDIIEALSFYGTSLTVLRAGLVVAPGSNTVRLLANTATRLPIVLLPPWANKRRQPIALADVIRAIRFCLAHDDTRNNQYEIGGPQVLTYRQMLQAAALVLRKKQVIVNAPFLTPRLYGWYLRLINRGVHPTLIELAVKYLGHDSVARSNPVQQFIVRGAQKPRKAIEPYIKKWAQLPPEAFAGKSGPAARLSHTGCSLYRRNAAWVAETYFQWLPRFSRLMLICEVDADRTCRYYNRFPKLHLLTLSYKPEFSSPDRQMYFITGGLLAKGHEDLNPRMEFRDVLKGRYTIVALHDFRPVLPWFLFALTQAYIHLIVMRNFQKYIAGLTTGPDRKT